MAKRPAVKGPPGAYLTQTSGRPMGGHFDLKGNLRSQYYKLLSPRQLESAANMEARTAANINPNLVSQSMGGGGYPPNVTSTPGGPIISRSGIEGNQAQRIRMQEDEDRKLERIDKMMKNTEANIAALHDQLITRFGGEEMLDPAQVADAPEMAQIQRYKTRLQMLNDIETQAFAAMMGMDLEGMEGQMLQGGIQGVTGEPGAMLTNRPKKGEKKQAKLPDNEQDLIEYMIKMEETGNVPELTRAEAHFNKTYGSKYANP